MQSNAAEVLQTARLLAEISTPTDLVTEVESELDLGIMYSN